MRAEATTDSTDGVAEGTSPPSWSAPASQPAPGTGPPTTITHCSAHSSGGSSCARSATPPIEEPGRSHPSPDRCRHKPRGNPDDVDKEPGGHGGPVATQVLDAAGGNGRAPGGRLCGWSEIGRDDPDQPTDDHGSRSRGHQPPGQ